MKRTLALVVVLAALLVGGVSAAALAAPKPSPPPYAPGYVVVQASEAVGPGSGNTVAAVASCPEGKVASGGGAQVPADQDPAVSWALQYNISITDAAGNALGWIGQARRYGGESTNTGSVVVRVICVNP